METYRMLTIPVKPDPSQISLNPFTKTTLALITFLLSNINLHIVKYEHYVKWVALTL